MIVVAMIPIKGALYLEGQQHTGDKQTEECGPASAEPGRVQETGLLHQR